MISLIGMATLPTCHSYCRLLVRVLDPDAYKFLSLSGGDKGDTDGTA